MIKRECLIVIDGYQIHHNFIIPHMGLNGKTPADKAGIKINGDNKWITLIQNSIIQNKNKV